MIVSYRGADGKRQSAELLDRGDSNTKVAATSRANWSHPEISECPGIHRKRQWNCDPMPDRIEHNRWLRYRVSPKRRGEAMRTFLIVLIFLSACLSTCFLLAQTKKAPPVPDDPQSRYEPRSSPGEGQKFLQKFVGDWDVVKTFHPRSGDPVRQGGECRQTMLHDGRFLQSEFLFRSGKTKTTGTGLIGFDPASGRFTSVWIDSRSTRMSFRRSKEKFDGKRIELLSSSLGDDGKKGRTSHTITHLEEDGRRIVHRQYTASDDGKERLVMELILTKKPEKTPTR